MIDWKITQKFTWFWFPDFQKVSFISTTPNLKKRRKRKKDDLLSGVDFESDQNSTRSENETKSNDELNQDENGKIYSKFYDFEK